MTADRPAQLVERIFYSGLGGLAASKRMLRDGGLTLVMDEGVADEFEAPGSDVERMMYGWSITLCLPGTLTAPPAAGTGTVMRTSTLERYAKEAGTAASRSFRSKTTSSASISSPLNTSDHRVASEPISHRPERAS